MRAVRGWCAGRSALLTIALLVTGSSGLRGADEPYLAIRTGFRCSHCHTNRTGGGKRNDFGVVFSQTRLPALVVGRGTPGPFLSTRIGELLSLGGNLRVRTTREVTGDSPKNPIDITEGTLYGELRLVPDRLTVYVDQLIAPGTPRTRELFLLIDLPAYSYLKAGRFFLPYGFRLLDDLAFIRQRTGFNYNNSDLGIELGLEPGPLSLAIAVTNGTQGAAETNSSKQVTGMAALVFDRFRFGGSASHNQSPSGKRDVAGAFGGFRLGRFVFLGELDYIYDDPPDGRRGDELAAFVEGDLLLAQGVNLKVAYGFLDPDRDIGENARTRLRVGLEPFITQFLQVAIFYTVVEDIPQATTDRDELSVELHGFF